jgi:signal transduction histidine kinase
MVLEVTDDGTGFDPAAPATSRTRTGTAGSGWRADGGPSGFGLAGMRERAELLGGRLDLSSAPGRGTTVRLTVPLSPAGQSAPASS